MKYNNENREYDDQITIRLKKKYYRLLGYMYKGGRGYPLRQLIRCDLYNEYNLEFETKDYKTITRIFKDEELEKIVNYSYEGDKPCKLTIRLYKQDKTFIKKRNENISDYIDSLINCYIVDALKWYETHERIQDYISVLN